MPWLSKSSNNPDTYYRMAGVKKWDADALVPNEKGHADGLVQECNNYTVLTLELLQSWDKPSMCAVTIELKQWSHDMEKPSALLAICVGNSLVTGGIPSKTVSSGKLLCFTCCQAKQAVWTNSWVAADLTHVMPL